jgi:hypothetical protein
MESVKQLQEERVSYLAKVAQRSPGFSPLGGSEIRAIADQHVRHIERSMSARFESYRQAFTEAIKLQRMTILIRFFTKHSASASNKQNIRLRLFAISSPLEAVRISPRAQRHLLSIT